MNNPTKCQNLSMPITLAITDLTHDGRGVATYDESCGGEWADKIGKKIFVNFALPNETVQAVLTHSKKHFDEGDTVQVVRPSPHRTTPICRHFGVCGGCSLQHFDVDEQIQFKQSVLQKHFAKSALVPDNWLAPIVGERIAYRTKARLGVRYIAKTGRLIVGFRERASNFLADIDGCPILDRRVGDRLGELKAFLATLDSKGDITHLELAMGDDDKADNVAMIVRHTAPMGVADKGRLLAFGASVGWQIYLQPTPKTWYRLDLTNKNYNDKTLLKKGAPPVIGGLFYELPAFGVRLQSSPTDFTQVNLSVNRQMVARACELLDLQQGERVLDLFCGLGNFSLAMAKCVGKTGFVIGVEGSAEMVARATMNAKDNGLANTQFFVQDLTQDFADQAWVGQVDALLIDPPRSGAAEVMAYLGRFNAKRIVYVSCDPATLARDSVRLVEQGYRLTHAGVMDMFCYTGHMENIARFEKI